MPDSSRDAAPSAQGETLSLLLKALAQAPAEDPRPARPGHLEPGATAGRYVIRRHVGQGGFGAVYEAFDPGLVRPVALKTLHPGRRRGELGEDWIRQEAKAISCLDHPAIVTAFDVGTCPAGPYLVMELLRGESLAARLERGPLPIDEALRVAEVVASALAHAHQRGLLHRDLKPANVYLCEDGRVKLLDFGLAHLLGVRGAEGSGTPGYMAPEQARGDALDARADVHAAAVTLLETLTGRRVPGGGRDLPAPLAALLARGLSTNRDERPRDGTAWLEELGKVREGLRTAQRARRAGIVLAGLAVAAGVAVLVAGPARPPVSKADAVTPSVAVLPFADLSPGRDQAFFSDGVAEEILAALSKVQGLRVAGRGSSFHFKGKDVEPAEIARRLGVVHLLQGSVRRSGSRLRISAEVVRAADGQRVWAEAYDRELTDVFEVQDQIARAVAEELRVRLLPAERPGAEAPRPRSPEAYREFLLGRHLRSRYAPPSAARAVAAFERSLGLDPGYASAWAGLSLALMMTAEYRATLAEVLEDKRRALEAANRAVALAPRLAEAYTARADLVAVRGWDWIDSLADARHAIQLDPRSALAHTVLGRLLVEVGRMEEGLRELERAADLDPLDAQVLGWLSWGYELADHRPERRRVLERLRELAPESYFADAGEGLTREQAIALLQRAPGPGAGCDELMPRAEAFRVLEREREARAAVEPVMARCGHTFAWQIRGIWMALGDADRAAEWTERAIAQLDEGARELGHPAKRGLHGPRYEALLARVNLPLR